MVLVGFRLFDDHVAAFLDRVDVVVAVSADPIRMHGQQAFERDLPRAVHADERVYRIHARRAVLEGCILVGWFIVTDGCQAEHVPVAAARDPYGGHQAVGSQHGAPLVHRPYGNGGVLTPHVRRRMKAAVDENKARRLGLVGAVHHSKYVAGPKLRDRMFERTPRGLVRRPRVLVRPVGRDEVRGAGPAFRPRIRPIIPRAGRLSEHGKGGRDQQRRQYRPNPSMDGGFRIIRRRESPHRLLLFRNQHR